MANITYTVRRHTCGRNESARSTYTLSGECIRSKRKTRATNAGTRRTYKTTRDCVMLNIYMLACVRRCWWVVMTMMVWFWRAHTRAFRFRRGAIVARIYTLWYFARSRARTRSRAARADDIKYTHGEWVRRYPVGLVGRERESSKEIPCA